MATTAQTTTTPLIDFQNTEHAFAMKTDGELKKSAWLFSLMNNSQLVDVGSKATLLAVQLHLPVTWAIKQTIFEQFCGGTTLLECVPNINKMAEFGVTTMLDYGTEAKSTETDFNKTMRFVNTAIRFAHENDTVQVVTIKLTGLMPFFILEKLHQGETLNPREQKMYDAGKKRVDSICHVAWENGVQVYIDAEESWIQDPIDEMAMEMILRYNKERPIVFNTYQMYRHDRLAYLKQTATMARDNNAILGAKLVRGAYMEKERQRAEKMGAPSPIQPNKAATDRDYNEGLRYCADHYEHIAVCAATHNAASSLLLANLMVERDIDRQHPHFVFCQLYGMSDHLTFNLSKAGFTASKYMVYGPVRDVVPYLIRRAQENSSVSGDVGRELKLLKAEIKRRKA